MKKKKEKEKKARDDGEKKVLKKELRKNQKKKKLIVVAGIAFLLLAVVVIVSVVAVVRVNSNVPEKIDDNYFASDTNKLVLSLSDEMASYQDGEFEPSVTHVVYYYDGDNITDIRIFFAYNDEEEAEVAYDGIGDGYKDWASNKEINGKYIVFWTDSESYKDLNTERVRKNIESIKAVGGAL